MNDDISCISGSSKLTSKPRVSLESTQQTPIVSASGESQEMEKMALEIEQLGHAFTLVKEIRTAIETALKNLN